MFLTSHNGKSCKSLLTQLLPNVYGNIPRIITRSMTTYIYSVDYNSISYTITWSLGSLISYDIYVRLLSIRLRALNGIYNHLNYSKPAG